MRQLQQQQQEGEGEQRGQQRHFEEAFYRRRRHRRTLLSRVLRCFVWYAVISRCVILATGEDDDEDVSGVDDGGNEGETEDDSSEDFPLCEGDVQYIRDGLCDASNNNAACEYDGGDCCWCTCQEGLENVCGEDSSDYDCLDPEAECSDNSTSVPSVTPTADPTGKK